MYGINNDVWVESWKTSHCYIGRLGVDKKWKIKIKK